MVTKLNDSNWEKTQKLKSLTKPKKSNCDKTKIASKLKKKKTSTVSKLKNSNCDQTQNLK